MNKLGIIASITLGTLIGIATSNPLIAALTTMALVLFIMLDSKGDKK